jgi:ATP-dependent RNA helicase HelY
MNPRPPEIPPHKLISALRGFNLLPAIIFMPTRRKCDEAASEVAGDRSQKTDPERQKMRRSMFDQYAVKNPEVRSHKHAKILVNSGVASHHAGHIPAWKLLIEKMMSGGLLNAIFATSTVAAGVDFPARTVVISNADTRGNEGWRPLSASELQQMTGRAGRRGKDKVGFAVLIPGQFQDPKKIAELLKSRPEPLESRFRATYTSLLNLLDAFGSFEQVREIAQKSFAYQPTTRKIDRVNREIDSLNDALNDQLRNNEFGFTIEDVRAFERLTNARTRLQESLPVTRAEMRGRWLRENVLPGRVVTHGRSGKRFFLVLNVSGEKVSAMRDDGQGTSFELSRVNRVFENTYPIRESVIEQAFFDTYEHKNPPIEEPKLSFKRSDSDEAVELIDSLVEKLLPAGLNDDRLRIAQQILWEAWEAADKLERKRRDIDVLYSGIWQEFEKRAKVLDHFGYIEFASETVTESGKWLADVRVDRPLLVGEALRRGIFDDLKVKTAAGLMASLAADSDRNYGELYLSDQLLDVINSLEDVIYEVSNAEWKNGIEPAEEINLSAAAAAERWADGMEWNDLVNRTKAEEGDLFRLLARTGEALMQIAFLDKAKPEASLIARQTAEAILREPVR